MTHIAKKRFYKSLFNTYLIFEIVDMIEPRKIDTQRISRRLSISLLRKEERVYNVRISLVGI
jgi:hypothetical protein